MNEAIRQLIQLILQGITWVLRTIEKLWLWSWSQITAVFNMSWDSLPAWKMVLGVLAMIALGWILFIMLRHAMQAFKRIAEAFWTMVLMFFTVMVFMVIAGLFSLGFQWIVTTVPDRFWERFI